MKQPMLVGPNPEGPTEIPIITLILIMLGQGWESWGELIGVLF